MPVSCPKLQQHHEMACPSLDLKLSLHPILCSGFHVLLAISQIFQAGFMSGHSCSLFPLPRMIFMEAASYLALCFTGHLFKSSLQSTSPNSSCEGSALPPPLARTVLCAWHYFIHLLIYVWFLSPPNDTYTL